MRKQCVAPSVPSADMKSTVGGDSSMEILQAEDLARIDLTIDSGCAACALPVGVASAAGGARVG